MQRNFQPELMDEPEVDPDLLADDLENLIRLNQLFGGRRVIRRRLEPLLRVWPRGELLTVLDIGSGAGDLCRAVVEVCRRHGTPTRVWALDCHARTQAFAVRSSGAYPEIRFLRGDARCLPVRDGAVDLTLCTLALHHFADADAVEVLAEMRRVTRRWAVVSDLCRSRPGYAAVWAATRFCRNPLTRHDGPVSVQRAFTRPELLHLSRQAGWDGARWYGELWFRMSVVLEVDGPDGR
ncbi:MAG: methyltransferase domain-containing protein [Armatimonadetes bacterium]|nr:methyltransferase domain-containing protein [Armatimonadota bacterium]